MSKKEARHVSVLRTTLYETVPFPAKIGFDALVAAKLGKHREINLASEYGTYPAFLAYNFIEKCKKFGNSGNKRVDKVKSTG